MSDSPLSRYQRLIQQSILQEDAGQAALVSRLQDVFRNIHSEGFFDKEQGGGLLASLFNRSQPVGERERTNGKPNSLYIWGGVGRGKSMLMDMFFDAIHHSKKRRVHFHAFMQEVHHSIRTLKDISSDDDSLTMTAANIAAETDILCFDEFQVHDIADAMILSRLFTALFDAGMIIIFTSNRPPSELYIGGLQRERFMPFVNLLNERCDVIEIISDTDYRKTRMRALSTRYFSPLGDDATRFINNIFTELSADGTPHPQTIPVKGRKLHLTHTCREMVMLTFDEICAKPLGSADYLELATVFHTFLMHDIPILTPEKRNEAKRFVTFIDVLYEHKARFICSAAAPPDALYPKGDGSFEFDRTVSRLLEMSSEGYPDDHE